MKPTDNSFNEGLAFENDGQMQFAAAAYKRVSKSDPSYAAAQINLGTFYYNQRDLFNAEYCYRAALLADPNYALAWFDLGNVLDDSNDLVRTDEAIEAYRTALKLAPTYDDAHYNLALALEKAGKNGEALLHWQAYIKLDLNSPWATHARAQCKRHVANSRLKLVVNNGAAKKTGTSKLFIVKETINGQTSENGHVEHRAETRHSGVRSKSSRSDGQQDLFGGGEAS